VPDLPFPSLQCRFLNQISPVSVGGNPLHGFLPTYHLTNVGGSPDYQKPGFNNDAIFISFNNFGPGGGADVTLRG
jgi:hypothetical protein